MNQTFVRWTARPPEEKTRSKPATSHATLHSIMSTVDTHRGERFPGNLNKLINILLVTVSTNKTEHVAGSNGRRPLAYPALKMMGGRR